ncbi:acyltransferase family protein [Maribacter sp.]|uniref:acyltransferase family protein n=1 Tax=Maribacter sp. TaxID=1897614 RepID=UPI0025BB80A1|nr:acyltransferase family protein [Maribacter sp.]
MKERLISPDFIKGFCIILMVYGHITHIGKLANDQNYLVKVIYTFHMPLFLIISGYFFNISLDVKTQVHKILKKIALPYVIFISLYLMGLILVTRLGIPTNNKPPTDILSFIKKEFIFSAGSYWFLHSLILISLSTLLVNYLIKDKNSIFFYISLILLFLVLDNFELLKIRTATYFLLGYVIKHLTNKKIEISPYYIFFLIPISVYLYFKNEVFSFSILEVLNCFIILSILWFVGKKFKNLKLIKFISWIGQNTLIILLTHSLFIIIGKIFRGTFLKIDESGILYSLIITATTITLSLLSSVIMDKLSLSKYLFGIDKIYTANNIN